MSGGVGNRFWPFSRESMPKQFLDFCETGRSLLQQTFDRFKSIVPTENIFVVTNKRYAKLVREQLPDLCDNRILLEPVRRNTAPCIAYSSCYIKSINSDANIVVSPSDHLILQELDFANNIRAGLDVVRKFPFLLTIGIKPIRPESGYGYIQTDKGENYIRKVKTFIEKPDHRLINRWLKCDNFFWNSGIFIWNVNVILKAFSVYLPDIWLNLAKYSLEYTFSDKMVCFNENFAKCSNISIDYGIMGKAKNVYMILAEFSWSDLGSWGALYNLSKKDAKGNATLKCQTFFIESENNFVTHSEGKFVVIQGLSNYMVIEYDNVLLICKKSEDQRIGRFLSSIKTQYGEKYI
jgi:mannose-1-phosphate guanylyltransferase